MLRARGDIDSADFLSSVVTDKTEDKQLRVQAAAHLLPYQHAKVQPIPALVFVVEAVDLPYPEATASTQELRLNIVHLDKLFREGVIDLVTYNSTKSTQEKLLYTHIDEQKLLTAQGGGPDTTIRIEGGMPQLPGTTIIMPDLTNGNVAGEPLHMNGHPPNDEP
jgi:hypothetical protein